MLGAGGTLVSLAGGAVATLGRVVDALEGGGDERPELEIEAMDSTGTVTVVEPEEAGGGACVPGVSLADEGGKPGVSDAGGLEPTGGVTSEDCGVAGGGAGSDGSGVPGGVGMETGGVPAGGVTDAGGRVPGMGGVTEAGAPSQTVTVTVAVTVFSKN